ncbi:hypothetical protein CW751_08060 [Brumimicrobium salinarum]|uniref:Cyclic GMP-AMP synthase n=1 Tax=Brumimicrobium salinarum TaxID=2058658 RepID=A0A2I0R2D4_9FLAO|nr:hypothetical protein [Brumimicrobium salinarum]PKR80715.1 hypothetical protein CW751_08060 [Brumimicrobium salinarum]
MSVLHKEFIGFNKEIKLDPKKKEGLLTSRKDLRKKIKKWFSENKSNELQPKFASQGSIEMDTAINPIPVYDEELDRRLFKYDLDDGIYFIEKEDEDNRKPIQTWHNWVFDSVDNHTKQDTIRKQTCIRVVFADGHHIDLPIYYKKDDIIELAHRTKDWTVSDAKAFFEWFNELKSPQLVRIVRYLKAWKDYRELKNSSLKLPSGFELTILAVNNYTEDDNDDFSFRETVRKIDKELNKVNGFKCIRPTTPKDEDVFADYSETRKNDFLKSLGNLLRDLDKAEAETNFKKASEVLIKNQFGDRFPLGEDKDQDVKSENLGRAISTAPIIPRPYGY